MAMEPTAVSFSATGAGILIGAEASSDDGAEMVAGVEAGIEAWVGAVAETGVETVAGAGLWWKL